MSNRLKNNIIQSARQKYEADRQNALTDMLIYLHNPAGIGEHSDITAEFMKKLEEYDRNDSILNTIDQLSNFLLSED